MDNPLAHFLDLREQKTLARELPGQLAKRDEELQLARVRERRERFLRARSQRACAWWSDVLQGNVAAWSAFYPLSGAISTHQV
jgi:hypothetical protein